MTMRRNQALQMAAVRNQQGGSGFAASSGSKLSVESSVAEVFEKAIADQMRSNAISDQNARRVLMDKHPRSQIDTGRYLRQP